jgi:hypothetical protein
MQITEAYKKLSSVMEGKDAFRGDEQHEIAAFMRMFMDMVGMSESDALPSGKIIRTTTSPLERLLITSHISTNCLFGLNEHSCNDVWDDVWFSTKQHGGVEH